MLVCIFSFSPENVPRLFDLVKVKDDKYLTAFYYALTDTLVANDLDQATRIALQVIVHVHIHVHVCECDKQYCWFSMCITVYSIACYCGHSKIRTPL